MKPSTPLHAILIVSIRLCIDIVNGELIDRPQDTYALAKNSTYFKCSTTIRHEFIHWYHYRVGENKTNFVYYKGEINRNYGSRYTIETKAETGTYNLHIASLGPQDAGMYVCQDDGGTGSAASAQLIVLDSDPICEPRLDTHEIIGSNKCGIEPNQLILSCTAKYKGNEAPKMEWRRTSDNIPVSEGLIHVTIDNNRVVYNLTIKGNSAVNDGDSYFCNTTGSTMSNYGCKSGNIKVKGTVVDCSTCEASESCNVNSYIAAVICLFLIILPTAIIGTVFVVWYLRVYRPRKLKEKVLSSDDSIYNGTALNEVGTREEMDSLHRSASSLEECNNDPDIKIKTLENQLKKSHERIDRRDKTINDLKQNEESSKAKINSVQLKNDQLQDKVRHLEDKVKDLEQRLYAKENIDYLDKPVLVHMIQLSEKNKGKIINGITVLGTELFIVTKLSQEIEVYDSKTFQHERNMEIRGMTDPLDIASSKDANCLYVVDRLSEENESKVMRLDPTGKVLHQWPTGGRGGRLSTYGSNVILCLSDKQLINEYSPIGELIVTVRLSPAAKLNSPQHAIKVTSTCFVVSHGDFKDELHRVCVVDLDGQIKNECTEWEKQKATSCVTMKVPICLLEDNNRSIIVADADRNRILLLSSMLKYQRKLIEEKNGLTDIPFRLCFDDTQSRLFVAVNKWNPDKGEWEGGHVLIYNVK